MKYITSTHLANWAPERDCQENFALMIRRLIHASPVKIIKIEFPGGDNINLPGFDGSLEISGSYTYLPDGNSKWEWGTGKDYRNKADEDFKKRTTALSPEDRSDLSFVFATPYVWPGKNKWISKKKDENQWKDVRVIDGLLFEEWLESNPPVASWLAKFLQLPQGNTIPLDRYWAEWRTNQHYTIPASLITYERDSEVKNLTKFLQGPAAVFSIKSNTIGESIAFMAATLDLADKDFREDLFSKTLIVENETTGRELAQSKTPIVMIVHFEPGGFLSEAVKNGHHVVIPIVYEMTYIRTVDSTLPRITRQGFETGLKEMGIDREEAERFIMNSGLSLTVLRRLLGFDQYLQPDWTKNGSYTDIIPAILAGTWDEENENDKNIISVLAGERYETYIRKLTRWKLNTYAPVFQVGSLWHITSPQDIWSILGKFVTKGDFENLRQVLSRVTGELNPEFESEQDRRLISPVQGRITKFSGSLKKGLTETLILIAVFGESLQLATPRIPQRFADQIVREILENANGAKWCSLSWILPILSEASPDSFLNAVEISLSESNPAIMEMFGTANGRNISFSTPDYYINLLWALENLAYANEYLRRVTLILGKLTRLDPGGRLNNRPINSLKEIHVVWFRQVNADFENRKNVLEHLMQNEPEIAWDLFQKLGPDSRGITHDIHRCKWRFNAQLVREVLYRDIEDFYSFLFQKLLLLANGNEERLTSLVQNCSEYPANDRGKLCQFLAMNKNNIDHSKDLIWNNLRSLIAKHREFAGQSWTLPEDELKKLETVLNLYTPEKESRRVLWLFKNGWPQFSTSLFRLGMEGMDKFIHSERKKTLETVYRIEGFKGILEMAEEPDDLRFLGHALSELTITLEEEKTLLKAYTQGSSAKIYQLSVQYCFFKSLKYEDAFLNPAWKYLNSLDPDEKSQAAFFLSLAPKRYIWNFLEPLAPSLGKMYWSNVNLFLNQFPDEDRLYAIGRFQNENRHLNLISMVGFIAVETSTQLLCDILYNAGAILTAAESKIDKNSIIRIFEELYKRVDSDAEKTAELEWLFIDFISDPYYGKKADVLLNKLTTNPGFFIETVRLRHMPDKGTEEELMPDQQIERYRKSVPAAKLLDTWRTIPGVDGDGRINKEILNEWIKTVRLRAKEVNRVYGVDSEIGTVLACYPRNDTYWPAEEICEVIDSLKSRDLLSHFRTKIINSRGVVMKAAYEGGGQEQRLSFWFGRMYELVNQKYPLTASVLKEIAEMYQRDAKGEDDRAQSDEMR